MIAGQIELIGGSPSVVDVGAAEGYFAVRIAEEFGSTVLAIDNNKALLDQLSPWRPFLSVWSQRVSPEELATLPRFDVALALSVLHHFSRWRDALREIRALARVCLIELPHPSENWMRHAPARKQLLELHNTVAAIPHVRKIGTSKREGRNGKTYDRPMLLVPGTARRVQGTVFSGSGANRRNLDRYADESLSDLLGYEPFHGSLNLRVEPGVLAAFTKPTLTWSRPNGGRNRATYRIWRAWYRDEPLHVMIPQTAHPSSIEVWASRKLRDTYELHDGDQLDLDVELL